jgi:signal transduction histidine kinase
LVPIRSDEEVIVRNQELTALNAIAAAVSSSLELSEVVMILQNILSEQLGVAGGAVFFYNATVDRLELQAAWGLPSTNLVNFETRPALEWHYEAVIREKRPLQADLCDIGSFLDLEIDVRRPEWQSYLSVPLLAKGEIQGVVDLFNPASEAFTEERIAFFGSVGRQIGMAVHNARLFEQVRAGHERLQSLSRRLLEAQETERRHIARGLHDDVGHALTAVKINLEAMQRWADKPAFLTQLNESISVTERALDQVRNLSLGLRPSALDDLGLVPALRSYVDRLAQRGGFEAHLVVDPLEIDLPPEIETACFRVAQEALTNVVRHARARRVHIALERRPGALHMVIGDDGIGFDVPTVRKSLSRGTSLGLLGMEERVLLVGGQIEINSRPTLGTEVGVRFALPDAVSPSEPTAAGDRP